MAQLIDRRPNAKNKSTVNRQRFLRRYKTQIKKAISEQISERSITNIDGSESVSIPTRDISEPTFRSDKGGVREGATVVSENGAAEDSSDGHGNKVH